MKLNAMIFASVLVIGLHTISTLAIAQKSANESDAIARSILGMEDEDAETLAFKQREAEKNALIIQSAPKQLIDLIAKVKKYKESGCKKGFKQFKAAIILVGVPGTGKTSLAELFAEDINGTAFVNVDCTKLGNQYQNSAENNLRTHIAHACAQDNKLAVVVLDEIQALSDNTNPSRDATGRAFAKMIDEAEKEGNVLFIATANSTEQLPDMLLSRLAGQYFEIKVPEQQDKEKAIKHYLKAQISENLIKPEQIVAIAKNCKQCSYRDIDGITSSLSFEMEAKQPLTNQMIDQKMKSYVKDAGKKGKTWTEALTDKEKISTAATMTATQMAGGAAMQVATYGIQAAWVGVRAYFGF